MDNTEKTKIFWSKGFFAKLYRRFARKVFFKMHEKVAEQVLAQNPEDVLDIACGPGDFLLYLSTLSPNLNLNGTDVARGMVKYARQKLAGRANIFESNRVDESFSENSFDVVTIMMAFHHFPKKLETLQNIKKLLRPKGTIFIVDVIAKSDLQKKFWNIGEKVIGVRGYVGHYTENDIRVLATKTNLTFSALRIPQMPNRYMICKFTK